jgi:uncharacterized cupredoxin-like copper-binding protein
LYRPARRISFLVAVTLGFGVGCVLAQSHAPGVAWNDPENLIVDLVDYAFKPERLTIHRDTPTRLRLINTSESIHDFTAADFFRAVELRDGSMLGSSGIGITVEPHQEKDVDLVAHVPGDFGLICADHDWAGMTGHITVE